ncbi:MAG: hypothetical protein AAF667_16115 [Pseudomonadota bacterium]
MKRVAYHVAFFTVLTMSNAAQAVTVFTDRSDFIAQTSPQTSINFEGVPAGSSYRQQDLTVGNMTFNIGGGVFGFNLIAPGGQCDAQSFDAFDVDGSQYACSFIAPQLDLHIDFNAPVTSWGANFGNIGANGRRTELTFSDDDANVIGSYIAENNAPLGVTFIGLDFAGQEATKLTLSYIVSGLNQEHDIFGMDNVLFSTARDGDTPSPVPVPPGMFLLATAGLAFAGLRRRKPTSGYSACRHL